MPVVAEPTVEDLRVVLAELRRVLAWEMRNRSMWSAPPHYLGVIGYGQSWSSEALEELAFDGYAEIFVRRLPVLLRGPWQYNP